MLYYTNYLTLVYAGKIGVGRVDHPSLELLPFMHVSVTLPSYIPLRLSSNPDSLGHILINLLYDWM